ncbi:MAG: radical SAM protein [Candidatus Aminicenantes bacterium]|jgi:radical SAM superfamily enzyme YgiQ (UPF0313 family)
MKILLVNPYIYDFTAYDLWLRPLGLLYIAAVLKKYTNCELYWLDALDRFQEGAYSSGDPAMKRSKANGRGKYHREIVKKPPVYEKTPRTYARYGIPVESFREKINQIPAVDMILVTTLMTYWIDGIQFTVDMLKERFPTAKIVIGGVLPGLVPVDQLKNFIEADYFISGYGEDKILKIIAAGGGIVYSHPDLSDIDNIPYPAVEFLSSRNFLPLMTSRGCPFRCTYCASGILHEKFLERAPEKILDEIYYLHNTYGTQHFVVFDDALLVNRRQRFLKVFHNVSGTLKVHFHTPNGLHVSEIDRETAEVLFKCGFKTLRLSFESTTSEILSKSSNKVTIQQMVKAVKNLEVAGYERKDIAVYLLFGVPGQRLEQIEEDLEFVKSLGVTPHLSYFSPVPGTIDFINLQKNGVLAAPVNLYETNKIYFVYNKSNLSLEEIKSIKDQAAGLQNHG